MGVISFLLAGSLIASPTLQQPAAPPRAPQANPALWVVNDDDTIIYLFGTFHALDGRTRWFNQTLRTALYSSDQLMLETLVPRPKPRPAPNAAGNLSPLAPPRYSQPVVQLAPSASQLAASKLVMRAGRSRGLSTALGADAVLRDAADQVGKPVGGLESFAFQLSMFNSLPMPAMPAPTRSAKPQARASAEPAADLANVGVVLTQLQAGWGRGEVEQTFAPLLRRMQAQSPQSYDMMFVQRNVRWANWIAKRLDTPGTVFVAVGAGHLSGPDSVQNKLASMGVRSARVS